MVIIHAVNNRAYTPRILETALNCLLKTFPVVVVTVARQTGKCTIVQDVRKDTVSLLLSFPFVRLLQSGYVELLHGKKGLRQAIDLLPCPFCHHCIHHRRDNLPR